MTDRNDGQCRENGVEFPDIFRHGHFSETCQLWFLLSSLIDFGVKVIRELHCYKNCVISTGGGVVIQTTNWSYMRQGLVVWLNGSPALLASRVFGDGIQSRPLLSECSSEDEVSSKIANILSER